MRQAITYDSGLAGNIRSVARLFRIPLRILMDWQQDGLLSQEITPEQWFFVDLVRRAVWENRKVLRAMLANLPRSERRALLDGCEKSAIERIVYLDFLRVKLTGRGFRNDGRLITFERYKKYLHHRHPKMLWMLTRQVFDRQRKAAEARIRYCRQRGTLSQLISDLGLEVQEDGTVVNPWVRQQEATSEYSGRNIFHD